MKTFKIVLSWFAIICGSLAVLYSLETLDWVSMFSSAIWILLGIYLLEELKKNSLQKNNKKRIV